MRSMISARNRAYGSGWCRPDLLRATGGIEPLAGLGFVRAGQSLVALN